MNKNIYAPQPIVMTGPSSDLATACVLDDLCTFSVGCEQPWLVGDLRTDHSGVMEAVGI